MHLARSLIATALLAVLAASLPACRKDIRKPSDSPEAGAVTGGSGGSGGGGSGGTGGSGGAADTGPVADADTLDARSPDRPDTLEPDGPEPCGVAAAKCCPGNRCDGCCGPDGICVQAGTPCPDRTLSCVQGSCGGTCGGLRQKCCTYGDAGFCTYPLTVCVTTDGGASCQSCGNTGTPCCRDDYCETGRCQGGRCMP